MKRLHDTVAVVTGASRGIGAAIARAFAAEGARVVVASRKAEPLAAAAEAINADFPGAAVARACHMGHAGEVSALFEWAEANVGPVGALVNNAATNPHFGPLLSVTEAQWDKTFEVNLKGYFEATRQLVRRCQEAGRPGAVVNLASIAGLGAAPLQGVYGMTKAAVIAMTRTLAYELGSAGIRVNAIAPGLVETRFASALTGSPDVLQMYTSRCALGRIAKPEEIAGLAVFLASNESRYVTGQVIRVDGGYGLSG